MRQMPRDLWTYEVEMLHVADLSDADRLSRVGLDPPVPDRRQWPAYQAVGEAFWRDGWAGVLSSSAARPAAKVLCVFRPSLDMPGVISLPPPARHDEPPAPPRGLRT
jgi:RES domain-containing protein